MQKRVTFWAVLLLAVALIFSGCTSRLDTGSMVERDSDELFVDLPAIVIDYASDGTASIGGLSQMSAGDIENPDGSVYEPTQRLVWVLFRFFPDCRCNRYGYSILLLPTSNTFGQLTATMAFCSLLTDSGFLR